MNHITKIEKYCKVSYIKAYRSFFKNKKSEKRKEMIPKRKEMIPNNPKAWKCN